MGTNELKLNRYVTIEEFARNNKKTEGAEFTRNGYATIYLFDLEEGSASEALAFEMLFDIGGHETPLLSIPAVLEGDESLTYWRAIAIAANT